MPFTASAQASTFGGVGTRAEGMGGAFVAVADDASAVYWNPAGIAMGATFDAQFSMGRESTLFVGAALPVLGASYYRIRQAAGFTTVSAPLTDKTGDRERCTLAPSRLPTSGQLSCKALYQLLLLEPR
jgi:hypothetical protein